MRRISKIVTEIFDHRFRRTTFIILAALSFFAGVIYAEYGSVHWTWLLPGLLFTPLTKKKQLTGLVLIMYCGLMGGVLRGSSALKSEEPLRQYLGQKVILRAVVQEDGYYDAKKRISFAARTMSITYPIEEVVEAPIQISTFTVPSIAKGDVVVIEGKILSSRGNVAGAMYFADVLVEGHRTSPFDSARRRFTAGLENALPEPNASFAAGLLIGQRTSLQPYWQDVLRAAGITHIIAVSGYNLTILVRGARRLLKKRSRYQTLLASTLMVVIFLLITGFSPSIIRAAIVVALLQLSWFYGRRIHPLVLLSLAVAISAAIDPFQVWRSIGWYLSFAAFFGVVVLSSLLLSKKRASRPAGFAHLLAESIAAQLMTLPIIAMTFGQVSAVGLLANLVVAPFVPLAMLLSLLAGLAGWLVPGELAGWIAWPANILLTFMLDIAHLVAKLPGSRINVTLPVWMVIIFYSLVFSFIWIMYRRRYERSVIFEDYHDKITDEK